MKRSYDLIANVYDKLANLAFGKYLHKAQVYCLSVIPPRSAVLIVGGGTGWILEEIAKVHNEGLQIDYLDISEKMIALAKQRNARLNQVRFIQQSVVSFSNARDYDVVITPFLLDNFSEATAQKAFAVLHQTLKFGGLWLYTDFQVTKQHSLLHKTVLRIMYTFFRIFCNIEASRLPNVIPLFTNNQYTLLKTKTFLYQFIITAAYQKIENKRD